MKKVESWSELREFFGGKTKKKNNNKRLMKITTVKKKDTKNCEGSVYKPQVYMYTCYVVLYYDVL